jgi:hypothetical protein
LYLSRPYHMTIGHRRKTTVGSVKDNQNPTYYETRQDLRNNETSFNFTFSAYAIEICPANAPTLMKR